MNKITLPSLSYLCYSVDDTTDELIIEDIKSFKKGDGTILVKKIIDIHQNQYSHYTLSLYAYPQDDSIDEKGLIQFWLTMGFQFDTEQAEEGALMHY